MVNFIIASRSEGYFILDKGQRAGLSVGQRGHFECYPHPFTVREVTADRAKVVLSPFDRSRVRARARVAVGDQPSEPYCPSEAP